MMINIGNRGESTALIAALLILGFNGSSLMNGESTLLTQQAQWLSEYFGLSMILIGIGILSLWKQFQYAAILCISTALIIAVSIETTWPILDVSNLPAVPCLLLILGTLSYKIPFPQSWRVLLSMMFYSTTVSISVVVMLGFGVIILSSQQETLLLARIIGCFSLGLLFCAYLIRENKIDHLQFIQFLNWSIVVSGIVATALAYWLALQVNDVNQHTRGNWALLVGTFTISATILILACIRLWAGLLKSRESLQKVRQYLEQRHKELHERANIIRRLNAQKDALFNSMPIPVVLMESSGNIVSGNPALLDLLRIESVDQLISKNFVSYIKNDYSRTAFSEDLKMINTNERHGELEISSMDGEDHKVLYSLQVIKDKNRTINYIQGTMTDVTELRKSEVSRRKLESDLMLSQKLESVGRLAAGIAHEINTPMQYVGDNVHFLEQSFESLSVLLAEQKRTISGSSECISSEILEKIMALENEHEIEYVLETMPGSLARAKEGIQVVSHIVSAMKELAHPGSGSKASTDINSLVDTALTVTRNTYKTVANVEMELGNIPQALTYKNELCQVLINLIVNSAHAIESANESRDTFGLIRIKTEHKDGSTYIHVTDNGCGIPEVVLGKIFDPFFTTKGVGKGTGQGLAIARATIVDKHGGQLIVDSVVGQGTTFTIILPVEDSFSNNDISQ